MPFAALGLRAELVRAVADLGYAEPSAVQAACIPAVLAGRDVAHQVPSMGCNIKWKA